MCCQLECQMLCLSNLGNQQEEWDEQLLHLPLKIQLANCDACECAHDLKRFEELLCLSLLAMEVINFQWRPPLLHTGFLIIVAGCSVSDLPPMSPPSVGFARFETGPPDVVEMRAFECFMPQATAWPLSEQDCVFDRLLSGQTGILHTVIFGSSERVGK